MGKVILVTGGARSGKSSFAENALRNKDSVLYIATAVPYDEEMKERINHHQKQRPANWTTLEAYDSVAEKLYRQQRSYNGILLDCVTVMLTNLLFSGEHFDENAVTQEFWCTFESEAALKMKELIQCARNISDEFVLVTNEIGMGLVPETSFSRYFRDMAGRINQMLAAEADDVYFVVSGIPMKIKGGENR